MAVLARQIMIELKKIRSKCPIYENGNVTVLDFCSNLISSIDHLMAHSFLGVSVLGSEGVGRSHRARV